jgi:hypothetical protein
MKPVYLSIPDDLAAKLPGKPQSEILRILCRSLHVKFVPPKAGRRKKKPPETLEITVK